MAWVSNLIVVVALLLGLMSFSAKRWNACGSVFDAMPMPLDPAVVDGTGKVAIITGANAGLGFEVSRELYRVGYSIVMACRSLEKGEEAKKKIFELEGERKSSTITVLKLDMESFKSVRQFARDFAKSAKRLDLLINNAGIWENQEKTEDGIAKTAQVNHYSGFLLVNLLLPLIEKTDGHIVLVSSLLYMHAVDFRNDFKLLDPAILENNPMLSSKIYGTSKLMNVFHARALALRLQEKKSKVVVNSIMPGIFRTELYRNENNPIGSSWFHKLQDVLHAFIGISAAQAGHAVTNLAMRADFSGQFFHGLKPREMETKLAESFELENLLWDASVNITESDISPKFTAK